VDLSLQHDVSVSMARVLVDLISVYLNPQEQAEALRAFYQVCRSGLEAYEHNRAVNGASPVVEMRESSPGGQANGS